MEQRFSKLLIFLLMLSFTFFLISCEGMEKSGYEIIISDTFQHGTIIAPNRAEENDSVQVKAVPEEGYKLEFIQWNGTILEEPYEFVMPAEKVVLHASFVKEIYHCTIDKEISHGTISLVSYDFYFKDAVTIDYEPEEGYQLSSLFVNGVEIESNTFQMPSENVLISAVFTSIEEKPIEKQVYTITVSKTYDGTVTASKNEGYAGDTIILTITPNKGYEIDKIYVNDKEIFSQSFLLEEMDTTIFVSFKHIQYTVVIDESTQNGTILCSQYVGALGDLIYVTIRPDAGYQLKTLYVNGYGLADPSMFVIGEDVVLLAVFEKIDGPIEIEKNLKELREEFVLEKFPGYTIYSSSNSNPYGISLDEYGTNVQAIFYTPNLSLMLDPYRNMSQDEFYQNYQESSSYEDTYYRTSHKWMSGDLEEQAYLPTMGTIYDKGVTVRISSSFYILSTNGEYLGYVINDLNGNFEIIYYDGAYISLNEVSAYILAFGSLPNNSQYDKGSSGQKNSIEDYGIYGRVNMDDFSGNTANYPYEPELPNIRNIDYTETDFGTTGGYINENTVTGTYYEQKLYNDGNSISRGAARIVFVSDTSIHSIDERYVFYTYNHYNDFQEYLNYNNGFGERFGNETAGNEYCGSKNDYNQTNQYPVSVYPGYTLKKLEELELN